MTFSFTNYDDPKCSNFGSLQVIAGYRMHPRSDRRQKKFHIGGVLESPLLYVAPGGRDASTSMNGNARDSTDLFDPGDRVKHDLGSGVGCA